MKSFKKIILLAVVIATTAFAISLYPDESLLKTVGVEQSKDTETIALKNN